MIEKSIRRIIISEIVYNFAAIIGPLLIFAGPAYFLDRYFGTKPWGLLTAVGFAFVATNVLLFKKVAQFNRMLKENFPPVAKPESKPKNTDEFQEDQL